MLKVTQDQISNSSERTRVKPSQDRILLHKIKNYTWCFHQCSSSSAFWNIRLKWVAHAGSNTESVNVSRPGKTPELCSVTQKWIRNKLWCTYVTWNVTWHVSKSTVLIPCVRRGENNKTLGVPGISSGYTFKIDQSNYISFLNWVKLVNDRVNLWPLQSSIFSSCLQLSTISSVFHKRQIFSLHET